MKKTVLYFIFFLFAGTTATAQSTLDKLILEDAQSAYSSGNYTVCLEKIDELEKRGSKGLILAHLKIMAVSKMPANQLSYEQVVQFKKDVANYLKNYDNEDFMQQYKEVYEVSKTLSDKRYDEGELAGKVAANFYNAKDYKSAMQWYQKADSHGSQNSSIGFYIGYMYQMGLDTEKNYVEAAKWYTKAANQGSTAAQSNLGNIYYAGGYGFEKNHTKAAEWYTKAANQGDAYGQNGLGNCYRSGKGVEKDLNKALEWYEKAKSNGHPGAENAIIATYDELARKAEMNKDISNAIEWYKKAAQMGHENAIKWCKDNNVKY